MSETAIEVHALRKTYRDGFLGRRPIEALKDVSFSVQKGSIFGLLGPNGAGKTTLIKILLGLVHKTGGAASMLGRPAGDRRGRVSVGYLPENHRIPRHLTGNSAMVYYGGLSGMSISEVRLRRSDLLRIVGLEKWGNTSVRKYSKGMLQRLGLAQSILHDPELLILDEPTDGVDPVGRTEMRGMLQELKDVGKTIFINSHLLQEIELVCDHAAILDQGILRRVGRIEDITRRDQPHVEFILSGSEPSIRGALRCAPIESCAIERDGQFRVTVNAATQTIVNQCVDDLRKHGIDIVALSRPRDTLEAAFLDIVTGGKKPE